MGGSGGSSVDKKYNSRMAELAEMASSQSLLSEHERKYGFRPGGFQSQIDKQVYTKAQNADGSMVPVINRKALSNTVADVQAQTASSAAPPVTSAAAMMNSYNEKMANPLKKSEYDWIDYVGGA